MKVSHEKTKNKIFDICGLLREFANYVKQYRDNKLNILKNDVYSEKYKTDSLAQLASSYSLKHAETKEKLVQLLNDVRAIEEHNETLVDYDLPAYANAVTTITATGAALPPSVVYGLVYNFAGHYNVLISLEAILEKHGINPKNYGLSRYFESIDTAIAPLLNAAKNLEQGEDMAIISAHGLFNAVLGFGEVHGIEFPEGAKDFIAGMDEEHEKATARAMGLHN